MLSPRTTTAISIVGVVAVGLLFWQARPLYNWYQAKHAIYLAGKSQRLLEEKDVKAASDAATRAYRMSPDEPEVIRSLAKLYRLDGGGAKEALYLLNKLVGMDLATTEDRRELARTLAILGELQKAQSLAQELLLEDPNDPDSIALRARLLIAEGEIAQGLKLLRRAQQINPGDERDRLLLAQLYIEYGSFEEKAKAWMMLKDVAQFDNSAGTKALELLRRNFSGDGDLLPLLLNPPAEETGPQPAYVTDLKRRILLNPDEKQALLDEAWEKFDSMGRRATYQVNVLTRWLYRQGDATLIIDYLDWEFAKEDASLTAVYLSALGLLDSWERVKEILEDDEVPVSDVHRATYLAYCADKLDLGYPVMKSHLRDALKAARDAQEYAEALSIGVYAQSFFFNEIARQAFRYATGSSRTAQLAFEHLLAMNDTRTNAQALKRITGEFLQRYPNRPGLRERFLYLKLLTGIEVELAQYEMERILPKSTAHDAARMVLALAYYRMGDVEGARQLCESAELTNLSSGHKAVYAMIMAHSNRLELARNITRTIPVNLLLDEERALIASILPKVTSTN
ncbi:MAG: hypothetical protein AAF591_15690 [Verrucomicrobiota bacterium]